jgi:hypothetical protein
MSMKSNDAPPDNLTVVYVPALCVVLMQMERDKGQSLCEAEVRAACDTAASVTVPVYVRDAMENSRGYRDLDPSDLWRNWLSFKTRNSIR